MSLENASGGFTDLDELAKDATAVVSRIREFHPEETSPEGYKSEPVTIDLLICSGERKGEVVRGMKVKKGGVVSTLRRSQVGKDVAGVIVIKHSTKRKDRDGNPLPFAAMDPCDSAQMDQVKEVYRNGTGFDDNPNLVSAPSASAAGAGDDDSDSEPPF
jgi:hypothetical protein